MVERVVWDHEAAGSKPVTRTRKPAEIARFQRVFYVNCLSFAKRYSLLIAAQDLRGLLYAKQTTESDILLLILSLCGMIKFHKIKKTFRYTEEANNERFC